MPIVADNEPMQVKIETIGVRFSLRRTAGTSSWSSYSDPAIAGWLE
jgi:hypothetical protein